MNKITAANTIGTILIIVATVPVKLPASITAFDINNHNPYNNLLTIIVISPGLAIIHTSLKVNTHIVYFGI